MTDPPRASIILFFADLDGVLTMTSGSGLELLGRHPGSSVGRSILDLDADGPEVQAFHRAIKGDHVSFQTQFEGHTFDAIYAPRRNADGQIIGVIGASSIRHADVPEPLLFDLMQARLASLAHACRLSKREREVLELLMLGRSAADVATALGIAERTAKFHQRNVLEKVGAESRLDLYRVVLLGTPAPPGDPRRRRARAR